jgi:hypothetical protein
VVYGVFRYALLADGPTEAEGPIDVIFADRPLLLNCGFFLVSYVAIASFPPQLFGR